MILDTKVKRKHKRIFLNTKQSRASCETDRMEGEDSKLNVIRIKRKRGEDPVTSLLVEIPAPKKSYIDSFKALSTSEKESPKNAEPKVFCLVGTVSSHDTPTRLREKIKEAQQKRKLLLSTAKPDKNIENQKMVSKQQKAARSQEIKLLRSTQKKESTEYSDLFHLVDLVKVDESQPAKNTSTTNNNNNKDKEEELMCNYMPMVREFLNSDGASQSTTNKTTMKGDIEDEEDEDGDYVYDVYYTDDTVASENKSEIIVARIESFDEGLNSDNEYDDGDTDSDDEENRVTDIYPDEDEDPDFENEYGSSSDNYDEDSSDEYGYARSEEDEEGQGGNGKRYFW